MKPPSIPKLNKNNPNQYFIYWNHDVPVELWHKYPRKRMRIKVIDDINEYHGEAKDTHAEFRRQVWQYNLDSLRYNPFEAELNRFRELQQKKEVLTEQIEEQVAVSQGENRHLFTVDKSLHDYIKSRIARKLAKTSISAYQGCVDWINEGLTFNGHGAVPIGKIKYTHLSAALDYIAEDREWVATTINKEIEFMGTIFNWLEVEDYVVKNPIRGKFVKLPTQKSKHRWYNREIAKTVKDAVKAAGKDKVFYAMQFTYWLMIRSKKELQALTIGDIDRTLKRVRFSAALSKNKTEQYRDYPEEFEKVLDRLKLEGLPKTWFIFGKLDGSPGPAKCGHNFFSKQFKVVKDRIGLSPDFTIYGWKHTRIVHELMKGTDCKEISYMARHSDFKSTKDYLRDYDLTLENIYGPEDLTY
ncbi:tyrosine-type recombinase/integrase [Pedobacter sp.]|uniref:tyrosine-type recombinase/integrase n=1 Tax=Pedobacter sp. TaxID=1411316 RepID=UPI003D7F8090